MAESGDFTLTTSSTSGSQPLLLLHSDASEVSGVTNGSIVTPAIAPSGFTGKVVSNGGLVNFAAAQTGNGVYFQNCCVNTNNAYYKFTGATVGNIFNVNQGQITFYLKSRYSFAQRQASASAPRYAFDVVDGNDQHLFYFLTQVTGGYLFFNYGIAGSLQYAYVPQRDEDTQFGNGVTLKVKMTWDGSVTNLYLNDTLVKSAPYTIPAANWTAGSVFDLGAHEYQTCGGFNTSDDVIDEFTVTGPAAIGSDTTPPVVSVTAPVNGATVSGTVTVTANATDNVGVTGVQFQLDGANLGGMVTGTGPTYSYSWDTNTVADGAHTLTATASDAAGKKTTSTISVTVSKPVLPTVISSVSAGSVSSSGASITWNTDKASNSQVAYGTTSSYGSLSALNATLVSSHTVMLTGLAPSTTYHYQVQSQAAQGALASSADFTLPRWLSLLRRDRSRCCCCIRMPPKSAA